MGLYGVMTTSVSGMSVQGDRMSTVVDNIANVNTTGYKAASTEFATLFPDGQTFSYNPGSVSTKVRRGIDVQGELTYTQSSTDLAVNGNGFFMVQSEAGGSYLTRAGNFVPDANGDLVNAAGYKLLGYSLTNGNGLSSIINSAAGLTVVGTADLGMKAQPSTTGTFNVNLPAGDAATPAANLPSTGGASATYSGKTSLVTYDNLGNQVTLDIYSAKMTTPANTWEVSVFNHADASAAGGFPYTPATPLSTTTLTFDGTTGKLTSPSPATLTANVPNGGTLNLDIADMTQLAAPYTPMSVKVDGNAPAAVQSLQISKDGIVSAVYADGTHVDAFRIPLATVASPDNLTSLSGNVFQTNNQSGDYQLGDANTGNKGSIVSGALEKTTVDLATELTTMVEAQRSYTANSKVFQTGSELLDVLVNLSR